MQLPGKIHVRFRGQRRDLAALLRLVDGLRELSQGLEIQAVLQVRHGIVGTDCQCHLEQALGLLPVPLVFERHDPRIDDGFHLSRVHFHGAARILQSNRDQLLRRLQFETKTAERAIATGGGAVGGGEIHIQGDGLLEAFRGLFNAVPGETPPVTAPQQVDLVGFRLHRHLTLRRPLRQQFLDQLRGDQVGDIALHAHHSGDVALEFLRPDVVIGFRLYELRGDPHLVAVVQHRSFEYVGDVEFGADVRDGLPASFVAHDRGQGYDLQMPVARQRRDDGVGKPVAEIFLLGIVGKVAERQHRDGAPDRPARNAFFQRHGLFLAPGNGRGVGPARQVNQDRILPARIQVVVAQLGAQAPGFNADDGIKVRIKAGITVKHIQPDGESLQSIRGASQAMVDNVAQEPALPVGAAEHLAGGDTFHLRADCLR